MTSPDQNTVYFGSNTPVPELLPLTAGPLQFIFQNGMIRRITFNNILVCNRIYFALRDRHWNTIPGSFTIIHQSIDSTSFDLTFKGLYSQGDSNLESLFNLHGSTSGEINFSFKATALSSFYRNRIGFCTLLPIELCKNKKCRVIQSDSRIIDTTFPETISPWQLFFDIKSITYPISDFLNVTASFDGDLFEMEDQRNWTDYSYKIYSTRLSDPLPELIEKGISIEQKVTFTIASLSNAALSPYEKNQHTPILLNNTWKVPQIGTSIDYSKPHSIPAEYASLFAYIRFDVHFGQPLPCDIFLSITTHCRSLSAKPELVLYCTNNIQEELAITAERMSASGIIPASIIVHKQNESIVTESTITIARTVLNHAFPYTPLVFGTDKYFVELNRNRNSIDLCEHICYSLNPQVHTFDNESIMENIPGISSTIQTAQTLFENKKLHITPITLRPRSNQSNPLKDGGPDMRLYGLFGAAWTAGVLFYSIRNNVDSLCFFQLNGDHGIFDNIRNTVTPAYHLLSKVAQFSGGEFSTVTCGNTLSLIAFQLQKVSRSLLVIANLTDTDQTFEISDNISGKAQIIDSMSFEQLCKSYTKWEKATQQVTYTKAITLSGYAVMLIERDL